MWAQRRRQQSEEIAQVVERAKQRKEEEEKRFNETKMKAAKKLMELDEKIEERNRRHYKDTDDGLGGTINPSSVITL